MKYSIFTFLFFLLLLGHELKSQDIIYTNTGNKVTGKIVEITNYEIKYKDPSNLEGPSYIISKREVVLIKYQNGTTEIINPNPPSYSPNKKDNEYATKPAEENPYELYYMGKNLLSINALALMNGDVTILYDRDLLNNKLGLTALGSYNLNKKVSLFNVSIDNGYTNAKKNYEVGLGVNFLPSDSRRSQYFVGLMGKYINFDYDKQEYVDVNIGGNIYQQLQTVRAHGGQTMLGVTNGVLVRITPHFNFKLFATVGLAKNSPTSTTSNNVTSIYPKFYLGYCFGYRF